MYQTGETVVYGTTGVCIISEITTQIFDGKPVEYYVLKPVTGQESTVFVPVHNEKLTHNFRHVLSKDEMEKFILTFPTLPVIWTENEEERKLTYKDALGSAPRDTLISMIKGIWAHSQALRQKGKKLHIADERFFHEAEKMIYSEIAYVLGMDRNEVPSYIRSVLHIEME